MSDRARRLLARPIGENERRVAFALATAMLLLAAAVLTLVPRAEHHSTRTAPPAPQVAATTPAPLPGAPVTGAILAVGGGHVDGTGPAAAMAAGRAFLEAFLRFAYGQAPARFPDATRGLRAQLAGFHVAVDPAQRARRLLLLALRARPRRRGWEITALASDGTSSFPVAVLVTQIGRRWLATHLITAAGG